MFALSSKTTGNFASWDINAVEYSECFFGRPILSTRNEFTLSNTMTTTQLWLADSEEHAHFVMHNSGNGAYDEPFNPYCNPDGDNTEWEVVEIVMSA